MASAFMGVQNRQSKRQHEHDPGQPGSDFGQHIGRLCSEDVLRHGRAKSRAQPLALWALHQNNEHQKDRYDGKNSQKQVD